MNSCDVVIGKLGYSTLAEAYQAGVPYGFIRRPGFRESDILADYVGARMSALEVPSPNWFEQPLWYFSRDEQISAAQVGVGSDFDGGFGLQSAPVEIDTIADLQKIIPLLAEKGYTETDIAAIMGQNWINLLHQALP